MFDDFFGNRALAESLEETIKSGRVPQTILLAGPEGVGKATLVRRFAARLLGGAASIEKDDLSRAERLANVRNAFATRANQRLAGERIVLLDDVFTTGATTDAVAKVLLAAGAGEVCVWTVARGI